jgi:anti-anti-sigma factor
LGDEDLRAVDDMANHPLLSARAVRTADRTVVHLTGEVDLAATDMLRAVLRRQTVGPARPRRISVDLLNVTFLDATGLGVLLQAQDQAHAVDTDLVVCNAQPFVRRILDLTGVASRLGLT